MIFYMKYIVFHSTNIYKMSLSFCTNQLICSACMSFGSFSPGRYTTAVVFTGTDTFKVKVPFSQVQSTLIVPYKVSYDALTFFKSPQVGER